MYYKLYKMDGDEYVLKFKDYTPLFNHIKDNFKISGEINGRLSFYPPDSVFFAEEVGDEDEYEHICLSIPDIDDEFESINDELNEYYQVNLFYETGDEGELNHREYRIRITKHITKGD